jgi:hypothetical protein
MQTIAHTPAHAQHVPDGWSFPTLAAQPPGVGPNPNSQPVRGGGDATATMTRVRWGRILPLIAGIGLLAFGIWNLTNDAAPGASRSAGSGAGSGVAVEKSTTAEDATPATGAGSSDDAAAAAGSANDEAGTVDSTTPAAETPAAPAARAPRPEARPANRGGNRAGAGTRRAAPAVGIEAASANAASASTVRGGGAGAAPAGQLPMTGLETWIAAFLGILLLGVGVGVHVNAVRIGMTALLYRRGILLRPVDCARLAQERGLSQVRVAVSNALHRLLEEPSHGGDFVSARLAR